MKDSGQDWKNRKFLDRNQWLRQSRNLQKSRPWFSQSFQIVLIQEKVLDFLRRAHLLLNLEQVAEQQGLRPNGLPNTW